MLKPPKFNGQTLFETFWGQFTNCAEHSKWNRAQTQVYLWSSLEKEVVNILCDYGKDVTDSLTGLTKTLEMRLWGKAFADKLRMKLRNRRRKPDKSHQSPRRHKKIRFISVSDCWTPDAWSDSMRSLSGHPGRSRLCIEDSGKTPSRLGFSTSYRVTAWSTVYGLRIKQDFVKSTITNATNQNEFGKSRGRQNPQWKLSRRKRKNKEISLPTAELSPKIELQRILTVWTLKQTEWAITATTTTTDRRVPVVGDVAHCCTKFATVQYQWRTTEYLSPNLEEPNQDDRSSKMSDPSGKKSPWRRASWWSTVNTESVPWSTRTVTFPLQKMSLKDSDGK